MIHLSYFFLFFFFFYLIKLDLLLAFILFRVRSLCAMARTAPSLYSVSRNVQQKSLGVTGCRRGWTWRMEGPGWSFLEVVFLLCVKSILSLFSSRFCGMQGYCFNTMNSSVSSSVKITPLQQMISSCSGALITSFLGKLLLVICYFVILLRLSDLSYCSYNYVVLWIY